VTGIINVSKPVNWTSHDVVAKLRSALRIKRVGHGGTLDPMATGVLPIFVGRATRAAEFCENADKEYIAGLRLGLETDTQDITGVVLSECDVSITVNELSDILQGFVGAQKQIPPMYSAIKVGGTKLYELARRGIEVPRNARDIVISEIELLEGSGSEFYLRVACSKGTYIRTLCYDIGTALGCGGTMSSLCRVRAGTFSIEESHALDDVLVMISSGEAERVVIPVDTIFSEYPIAVLSESESMKCKNGARCKTERFSDGTYRFYGPDNTFLLLGEVVDGVIRVVKSFYVL